MRSMKTGHIHTVAAHLKVKTATYEIRPEVMPVFGQRWVVFVDGKRRHNCFSGARAKEVIRKMKAKEESKNGNR